MLVLVRWLLWNARWDRRMSCASCYSQAVFGRRRGRPHGLVPFWNWHQTTRDLVTPRVQSILDTRCCWRHHHSPLVLRLLPPPWVGRLQSGDRYCYCWTWLLSSVVVVAFFELFTTNDDFFLCQSQEKTFRFRDLLSSFDEEQELSHKCVLLER